MDISKSARALGKIGGKKRWEGTTPEERKEHASKMAKKRWENKTAPVLASE